MKGDCSGQYALIYYVKIKPVKVVIEETSEKAFMSPNTTAVATKIHSITKLVIFVLWGLQRALFWQTVLSKNSTFSVTYNSHLVARNTCTFFITIFSSLHITRAKLYLTRSSSKWTESVKGAKSVCERNMVTWF